MKKMMCVLIVLLLGGCQILGQPNQPTQPDLIEPYGDNDDLPFPKLTVTQVLAKYEENDEFIVVVGTTPCLACVRLKSQVLVAPPNVKEALYKYDVYWLNSTNPLHKKTIKQMDITVFPTIIRYRLVEGEPLELDRMTGSKLLPNYSRFYDFLTRKHQEK